MENTMADALPEHPGNFLKLWLMKAQALTAEALSEKSGLPVGEIRGIMDGKVDVTRDRAVGLKRAFGSASETMYRMQVEFNEFKETGKILSGDQLPKLDPI